MKQILLLTVMMLISASLFSQVYKKGIVEGKKVKYEVKENNLKDRLLIRNINNPDTTTKEVPNRDIIPPQLFDMEIQIAKIIHNTLTPKELSILSRYDFITLLIRVDRDKNKIFQIVEFKIDNMCDFWTNLPVDRLYEIEKAIIKGVKLPEKLQETYLTDDFYITVKPKYILDIDEANKKREQAIKAWQSDKVYEVGIRPNPKFINQE